MSGTAVLKHAAREVVGRIERLGDEVVRRYRRVTRTPFADPARARLIVHCAQHRTGGTWFGRVLRAIAKEYGLRMQICTQDELGPDADIFFEHHSEIDKATLPPFVGSHVTRDPRDMLVSAYFFHLWTEEEWANIPDSRWDGLTYVEHLKRFDQEEGILVELRRSRANIRSLGDWDYQDPRFLEFHYEDLIADEVGMFTRIFQHYGFSDAAVARALEIAEGFSFKRVTNRKVGEIDPKSHLRSGAAGQWQEHFTDAHKQAFKDEFGDLLIKLGYEKDDSW